jgi:hypothetical protein
MLTLVADGDGSEERSRHATAGRSPRSIAVPACGNKTPPRPRSAGHGAGFFCCRGPPCRTVLVGLQGGESGMSWSSRRHLARTWFGALALLGGLAAAGSARADGAKVPPTPGGAVDAPPTAASAPLPPAERLLLRNISLVRLNPLGLFDELRLTYRRRLYEHDSAALRDNFAGLGVVGVATPAFVRGGPSIEIQPASVLQLTASYEWIRYFGTFDILQSYPSARDDYSDQARKERSEQGLNYAAGARELTLTALLQAKVGPVAVRTSTRLVRTDTNLTPGDRVFYHTMFDIVAPAHGWLVANDTDALFVGVKRLAIGARYSMVHALLDDGDFAPGEPHSAAGTPIHRAGPFAAYTFYDDPAAKINTPTLVLLTQWWLKHRYRTGAEVSQAVPFVVIALAITSDLM